MYAEVVFSDSLCQLLPFMERLSQARQADLRLDGSGGLGGLLLVRRFFGPEILPIWRWKPGSNVAGGDRVSEVRLSQQYLTVALRTDDHGEGDLGFDVLVSCPVDPECSGRAWAPTYSVICLPRALSGELDHRDDSVCDVHGGFDDTPRETDDHALHEADRSVR
ncbi:hypothetical protein [Streptomyces sp. NPDC127190]|uniref:hypothetical protein n=1 Tax=unclassified Streptomyces TaxID=2593676 RepID=UPI0036281927